HSIDASAHFHEGAPSAHVNIIAHTISDRSRAHCFWGTEHIFCKHYPFEPAPGKGILSTTWVHRLVRMGVMDHAEAAKLEYDTDVVSYAEPDDFFYRTHDPPTIDRQGGDMGTQYRSAIFTTTPDQQTDAQRVMEEVQAKHFTRKGLKIVMQILPAGPWWDAKDYHQLYLFKNPGGYQCPTHRVHW
ncbi:unnamed protein product, partial [Mycena citricolor]